MTKSEEKKQMRRVIRALERELPAAYKAQSSAGIARHLLAMPEYQAAVTVFCFVGTDREIDTTAILKDALSSRKRLCVPLCVGDGLMELRQITALDQLVPGAYGILEPSADAPLVDAAAVSELQPQWASPGTRRRFLRSLSRPLPRRRCIGMPGEADPGGYPFGAS